MRVENWGISFVRCHRTERKGELPVKRKFCIRCRRLFSPEVLLEEKQKRKSLLNAINLHILKELRVCTVDWGALILAGINDDKTVRCTSARCLH